MQEKLYLSGSSCTTNGSTKCMESSTTDPASLQPLNHRIASSPTPKNLNCRSVPRPSLAQSPPSFLEQLGRTTERAYLGLDLADRCWCHPPQPSVSRQHVPYFRSWICLLYESLARGLVRGSRLCARRARSSSFSAGTNISCLLQLGLPEDSGVPKQSPTLPSTSRRPPASRPTTWSNRTNQQLSR